MTRTNSNIAKLSDKIHWSKDALAEWRDAMDRGDQTNQMISRYCKSDEKNATAMEGKRQSLQAEIKRMRNELFNANEEQRSLESILDRTAQLYRQAHQERRTLVDTWKDAVLSLRGREREIDANRTELANARQVTLRKECDLKSEIEFLAQQQQNNRETEQDISDQNANTARMRERLNAIVEKVALQHSESVTLKKLVHSLTARLQQTRQHNRQATIDVTAQTASLQTLTAHTDALRKKYESFVQRRLNADERLHHLDELVEGEEKQVGSIGAETSRLSSGLFRTQRLVKKWADEHKVLDRDIQGLESAIAAEAVSLKSIEEDLLRQTEIVYNIDYKITVYESRIAKMRGATAMVNPEIEAKILSLEELSEEKRQTLELVRKQVQRVEDDMRHLTNNIAQTTSELDRLQSKLDFQRLEFDGGQKELASTTLQNQELLVDTSMLKLRVHQMDELLQKQRDKVYNLQRHQNDLQLAMDERLVEIKTRKEMLLQQLKLLTEELAQLRADVGERNLKIVAIQARYENALERLGHNEDGTFVTATQIRIETAQEKQMLLRDGNELNERVLRAERDIKAIETTLLLLNYSNEAYKKTLEPLKEDSKLYELNVCVQTNQILPCFHTDKEMVELKETTARFATLKSQIKTTKEQLADKVRSLQLQGQHQTACEQSLEHLNKVRMENNDTMVRMHKEILDQKSKLERAQRELRLARKTARAKVSDADYFAAFERQMRVRELESRNNAVLQQLAEMVDAIAGISEQLFEKGISIPLRASARGSAARSSTSGSVRSGGASLENLSLPPDSSASSSRTSERMYTMNKMCK